MVNTKNLKINEKLACRVLSYLWYNESDGIFLKCRWNDALMKIAKFLLKGKDPVRFVKELLPNMKDDMYAFQHYEISQK